MTPSSSFWHDKRVFLTGHTGFKGSWLGLWLHHLGAMVHGYALPPDTQPNLFTRAGIARRLTDTRGDIRDYGTLSSVLENFQPDIVIHMAAQALVRPSYDDPVQTYSTNVMGTVHLLEAVRKIDCVRAVVNVTSDKCYENQEWDWGYRENDPLGGRDPYSNSKGCAELVTHAFRQSFYEQRGIGLATARAGNVIGGGDWSADRLLPDILRSLEKGRPPLIRSPGAIRPWQHVLEPLSGYLCLAQKLYEEGAAFSQAWNFGPLDEGARNVRWITEKLMALWGEDIDWSCDAVTGPHEANVLKLDISKSVQHLQWQPRWQLDQALAKTVEWHRAWVSGANACDLVMSQIESYTSE